MLGLLRSWRSPLLALTALAAWAPNVACTCGSGPYQGDYIDGDRPPSMKGVSFLESEKGDPAIVGCADGQREGFSDLAEHPRVAGCVGAWKGAKKLRDTPTGKACGDDIAGADGTCEVPADVCAPGWHVCGTNGRAKDLLDRLSYTDCDNAGPGRFNAGLSHSPTDEIFPCPKITKTTMLPCMMSGLGAEPVCCGSDCGYGKCKDAVWKGKTKISVGTTEGCGAVSSEHNGGVMCCYDGDGDPKPATADTGAEVAADTEATADTEAVAADTGVEAAPVDTDAKKTDAGKEKKPAAKKPAAKKPADAEKVE